MRSSLKIISITEVMSVKNSIFPDYYIKEVVVGVRGLCIKFFRIGRRGKISSVPTKTQAINFISKKEFKAAEEIALNIFSTHFIHTTEQ